MIIKVMDIRITLGLSFISLLFNFGYFFIVDHNLREAIKLSASSILTLGCAHAAHYGANYFKKKKRNITLD